MGKKEDWLSRCADYLARQLGSILPSQKLEIANGSSAIGAEVQRDCAPELLQRVARPKLDALDEPSAGCFPIVVCGEEEVPDHHEAGITDMLTCVSPSRPVLRPNWPTLRNHLIVRCDDVEGPLEDYVHPTEEHVRQMIEFGQETMRRSQRGNQVRLLVHCAAGISRSTAATLLILSMRYGKGAEAQAMRHLTAIRPHCRPNLSIIRHGDRLLDRDGQLVLQVSRWKARLAAVTVAH